MKLLKLIPDNTNVDFMRWRNVALMLQIALVVAALSIVWVKGLNLGIDFVGGQVVRTTFAQPVDVEQLRERVNALGIGDASIQEFGGPRSYQIRLPKPEGDDAAAAAAVTSVRKLITET
jgi:preprotein translocase subunit SecF